MWHGYRQFKSRSILDHLCPFSRTKVHQCFGMWYLFHAQGIFTRACSLHTCDVMCEHVDNWCLFEREKDCREESHDWIHQSLSTYNLWHLHFRIPVLKIYQFIPLNISFFFILSVSLPVTLSLSIYIYITFFLSETRRHAHTYSRTHPRSRAHIYKFLYVFTPNTYNHQDKILIEVQRDWNQKFPSHE